MHACARVCRRFVRVPRPPNASLTILVAAGSILKSGVGCEGGGGEREVHQPVSWARDNLGLWPRPSIGGYADVLDYGVRYRHEHAPISAAFVTHVLYTTTHVLYTTRARTSEQGQAWKSGRASRSVGRP